MIVPSLPASSYLEISELADKLKGVAKELQIDIVDGVFVNNRSWPFVGEGDEKEELAKLQPFTKDFSIEVDCMVSEPEQYLDTLATVGVKKMVIHHGSTDKYETIIQHGQDHQYALGLAITNDTLVDDIQELVPKFSYVQVMGIKNIGKQGEPFDERTLDTVRTLKQNWPELLVAVDGAVNETTVPDLFAAGARRFAPGSAITKAADPAVAYQNLEQLVVSL